MPIDPNLLISAPMLQDYLVDKDTGLPLSNGVITMYQDNSRTTLKNWYYQTGVPGNYTYVTLPNPLTLSAVGTISDANGNDIIPFYYPYDENNPTPTLQTYYVVVQNSNGETQFTRQNFPFVANNPTPTQVNETNKNLIVNNVFWRNIGFLNATNLSSSLSINGVTYYYATIAPSQHDGFTMSDIQFFKNANGASDSINFYQFVPPASNTTFPNQILQGDVTPEFYLNINCTGTGTESQKYLQIPLSLHVKSLSGYASGTLTIQAMSVPGSSNNQITVGVFQFLGSGVSSPVVIPAQTINLDNTWQKYVINIPIPSAANLTLGNGGDDALYIQIGYPTGLIFNINIATPSFYLSEDVPTDDFQTYDEVNAIISSPRTGDVRTSINSYYFFGWVPMNDGEIGSSSSNSNTRANVDTFPLFNQLWNIAKPYDSGSNFNPICQMYNSSGVAVNFSSSSIADFNFNNRLALTKQLGRVILGTVPISTMLNFQSTTFNGTNSSGNLLITTANTVNFFLGMPIVFTGNSLPGGIVSNSVYYVTNWGPSSTNQFFISTTFNRALSYLFVPYSSDGSGTVTGGVPGSKEGEYAHIMLRDEMNNHTHDDPSGNPFVVQVGSAVYQGAANSGSTSSVTGGITGYVSQIPFNVTQPGTFLNIFMKL